METLDTLTDACYTEMAYQRDMKEQGKQSVANLNSSYETMLQIATNLFSMINSYRALTDQISSVAEAYAETLESK